MSLRLTQHTDTAPRTRGIASTSVTILGVTLLGAIAAIHLVTLDDHLEEARWLGALFAVLVVGCALAAAGVMARRPLGWALGTIAATAPFIGFMLAATTGLGDVHETFDEPYGTLSLAIEAAFLAIVAGRLLASALRTDEGVVLLGRRSPRPQMAPEQRPAARDGERAGPAGSRM